MFNKGSKRKANQEKKNKYASKSLTRIIVSLFIAVVAWIGATSFEAYLLSDKNTAQVVMAKKDVTAGTFIDDENRNTYFTEKTVNSNLVTDTTITDLSQINGKTAIDITSGEIITTNRLYSTESMTETFKDPVEITFTVSAADRAICGGIRRGDIVDIIGISNDENDTTTSKIIKENVYVLDAYNSSGTKIESNDMSSQAVSFKIQVERKDAAVYNMAFSSSELTVVKVTDSEN